MHADYLVFGLEKCPYTQRALKVLRNKFGSEFETNVEFIVVSDKELFKKYASDITGGHKTYPMIFYKMRFIGGADDLIKYIE